MSACIGNAVHEHQLVARARGNGDSPILHNLPSRPIGIFRVGPDRSTFDTCRAPLGDQVALAAQVYREINAGPRWRQSIATPNYLGTFGDAVPVVVPVVKHERDGLFIEAAFEIPQEFALVGRNVVLSRS